MSDVNNNVPPVTREEIKEILAAIDDRNQKLNDALRSRYEAIKKKVEEMPPCEYYEIQCLEFSQGLSHLEMPIRNGALNWNNLAHGGAISTLVDTAAGAAVETLIDFNEEAIATIQLSVNFLEPGHPGKILCAKASLAPKLGNESISFLEIAAGNKKVVQVQINVIAKPERVTIATGSACYVIFGKRLMS